MESLSEFGRAWYLCAAEVFLWAQVCCQGIYRCLQGIEKGYFDLLIPHSNCEPLLKGKIRLRLSTFISTIPHPSPCWVTLLSCLVTVIGTCGQSSYVRKLSFSATPHSCKHEELKMREIFDLSFTLKHLMTHAFPLVEVIFSKNATLNHWKCHV